MDGAQSEPTRRKRGTEAGGEHAAMQILDNIPTSSMYSSGIFQQICDLEGRQSLFKPIGFLRQ